MTEQPTQEPSTFPSLRTRMGDWVYYTTIMGFGDVARWVTRTDQIHSNDRLRDWIQRELQQERLDEIASYLVEQPQHFFNAIIVGIHAGSPEWFPVVVGDSPVKGSPLLAEADKSAMGLLRLKGSEKVFAIDGQHRVEGIIRALAVEPRLATERLCVLFVAHESTPDGKERTRRLFSTVNRNAKPVSKGEIVALDEDDPFAVVTRRLVEEVPFLMGHRVAFGRQVPIRKTDKSAITTILGLYDLVQTIHVRHVGAGPKLLRTFTARRPKDSVLQSIYREQLAFWNALRRSVPAVARVLDATEEERAAAEFRHPGGGHLVLRPAGQKAFARAVRVLMNRNRSPAEAVAALADPPLELSEAPWVGVLWDADRGAMITRNAPLAQNLLLHLVGELPEPAGYPLREKYRTATGNTRLPRR